MSKESIKPFVQGIVLGAIALLITVFSTGWVVTSSSAQDSAEKMTTTAILDSLTEICVGQFHLDLEKGDRLIELKDASSSARDDYVEDIGWATMPGTEEPNAKVADKCARLLMKIE